MCQESLYILAQMRRRVRIFGRPARLVRISEAAEVRRYDVELACRSKQRDDVSPVVPEARPAVKQQQRMSTLLPGSDVVNLQSIPEPRKEVAVRRIIRQ